MKEKKIQRLEKKLSKQQGYKKNLEAYRANKLRENEAFNREMGFPKNDKKITWSGFGLKPRPLPESKATPKYITRMDSKIKKTTAKIAKHK